LAKAVGKLARTVRQAHWAGGATRTHVRDRRRAASHRVREIASKLRTRGKLAREESTAAIRRVTGELVRLAETAAAEAAAVDEASADWSNGAPDRGGRISYLKRSYGWDRARLDGQDGAGTWCGHGVFAHNLIKISALTA
jgi:hypothetical protein